MAVVTSEPSASRQGAESCGTAGRLRQAGLVVQRETRRRTVKPPGGGPGCLFLICGQSGELGPRFLLKLLWALE